ncbi:hypothetical protein SAMN05421553_0129 [Pseudomonas anguilliseptica]|uniref:Uncharacterized protein n=1 Tax=Pseudomonas anguilliseptica TaxID=53406 RepID=A0A1H4NTS2_PSEAG|nr:hypothetical protein SAMN05421553_0129 [Pseudomonas anguilliseptica]
MCCHLLKTVWVERFHYCCAEWQLSGDYFAGTSCAVVLERDVPESCSGRQNHEGHDPYHCDWPEDPEKE